MVRASASLAAAAITLSTGIFWGFYWLPVRALADMGLAGAWGTLAITLTAAVVLLPFVGLSQDRPLAPAPIALASMAFGGCAFALYSVGFLYGRVAIVILLWFLSPVWSTLIGRFAMGWPTPPLRYAAILVGIAGLVVMLGADGRSPWPHGAGEWMSLLGGVLWSFSTTGIRSNPEIAPAPAAFVFAVGAALMALALAPLFAPFPVLQAHEALKMAGVSVVTGGLWWGASIAGLMWAAKRLDPARVAILLMTEVLAGALSAAFFASERLGGFEILGGSFVLFAGVLEIWPADRSGGSQGEPANEGLDPER